jgi:hypothetical protein
MSDPGLYDPEPPQPDDYPVGLEEVAGFTMGVITMACGLVWLLKRKLWAKP